MTFTLRKWENFGWKEEYSHQTHCTHESSRQRKRFESFWTLCQGMFLLMHWCFGLDIWIVYAYYRFWSSNCGLFQCMLLVYWHWALIRMSENEAKLFYPSIHIYNWMFICTLHHQTGLNFVISIDYCDGPYLYSYISCRCLGYKLCLFAKYYIFRL